MIAHAIPSHANIITFPVNRRDAKHRGAVRRVGTRLEFLEIAHPVTIRIFAAQVGIQRIEAMLLFPAVRDAVTDGAEIGIEHEVIEQQRAPVADKQAAGIHEHQRICLQYPAIKDEFAVPHLQRARAAHAPDGHGATVQLKYAIAVWPAPSHNHLGSQNGSARHHHRVARTHSPGEKQAVLPDAIIDHTHAVVAGVDTHRTVPIEHQAPVADYQTVEVRGGCTAHEQIAAVAPHRAAVRDQYGVVDAALSDHTEGTDYLSPFADHN